MIELVPLAVSSWCVSLRHLQSLIYLMGVVWQEEHHRLSSMDAYEGSVGRERAARGWLEIVAHTVSGTT